MEKTFTYKASDSFSCVTRDKEYGILSGVVGTPFCIVRVYSQKEFSSVNFIYNRKHYFRSWDSSRTERGLAIMANKFVREMRNKEGWS